MKKISISIFFIFAFINTFAQQQVFTKVFYHNFYDVTAGGIIKTPDHHYLIYGNYSQNPLIIKMDSMGNITRSKVFTSVYAPFRAIAPTHDSCFIVVTEGMFVTKITRDCDTIWTRLVELGSGVYYRPSLQETNDFGTIILETVYDNSKSGNYIIVLKISGSSEIEWVRKISSIEGSIFSSRIKQTPDGGFVVFGSIFAGSPTFFIAPFLLKLSSTGDYEWRKVYAFQDILNAEAIDLVMVDDGLVLLTALNNNASIVKTDFDGNLVWGKTSGVQLSIELNYSYTYPKLNPTLDGGFVFTCGNWGEMVKLDLNGNKEWSRYVDLYSLEAIESDHGGFMVVGNGPLYGLKSETFNPQIGIIKTDSIGNSSECVWTGYSNFIDKTPSIQQITMNIEQVDATISCPATSVVDTAIYVDPGCVAFIGGVAENPSEPLKLSIYPNPSDGIFQVGINKQDISGFASLAIFNILGEGVFETNNPAILQSVIDLRAQPEGVYLVRCLVGEKTLSARIVISAN